MSGKNELVPTARICQISPRMICFTFSPPLRVCGSILTVEQPIAYKMKQNMKIIINMYEKMKKIKPLINTT